jgi:hypothetical protein
LDCPTACGFQIREVVFGTSFLAAAGDAAFEPVPASHVIGAVLAVWFFVSRERTVAAATGGSVGLSFQRKRDLLTRRAAPSAVVDPE